MYHFGHIDHDIHPVCVLSLSIKCSTFNSLQKVSLSGNGVSSYLSMYS